MTGAARGLGRAYTLELCRQGAAVVADDIDEAALKEVADAARDLPGRVHAVVCDVTGPDAPRTLLDAALRRYGLLGPAARTVTGRVLEAGNGQISAPSTWQSGPQFPLPSLMSPEVADVLLPRVLASAALPPEVLSS